MVWYINGINKMKRDEQSQTDTESRDERRKMECIQSNFTCTSLLSRGSNSKNTRQKNVTSVSVDSSAIHIGTS